MKPRSHADDVIELIAEEPRQYKERITDRRIMHRLTAEERARKIYKKSILRYKDVITLNKRMTCEDIRQEITETEVGNVEGISAIYEQIRYGAGEVDNHVIREMKAASGQNKRVNEKANKRSSAKMNQKKKTIVLWGVIIVLAAAVVALSVILVTKSRENNDPDGQKNAGTESVIEESGQDAEQKAEDGADQKKEKGASDTQKSTDDKKTLYAEVTVGSTWDNNGMTAATETVTIYNKTDKAATDWSVDLEFPGKVTIDQLWNGKYTADGSVVHVTAESYNEEIPAGGSIDFGYNLSASDVKPVRCTLMIAGKEVTTVTGDDQQKNDENAAQTDGQSADSGKKDQSGSDKVTDSKIGKKKMIRIRYMENLQYRERIWWMHPAVNFG